MRVRAHTNGACVCLVRPPPGECGSESASDSQRVCIRRPARRLVRQGQCDKEPYVRISPILFSHCSRECTAQMRTPACGAAAAESRPLSAHSVWPRARLDTVRGRGCAAHPPPRAAVCASSTRVTARSRGARRSPARSLESSSRSAVPTRSNARTDHNDAEHDPDRMGGGRRYLPAASTI